MGTSQLWAQRGSEVVEAVPPPEEILARYKRIEVADHPFFITLAQGPIDMEAVYLLMANLAQGTSGSVLLERFVIALSPWCARADDEALLGAGRRLAREGARPYLASDPCEALGAQMVGEIFAAKMQACLAHEMRRQLLVTGEALRWLDIHEAIGSRHARGANELATQVPRQGPSLSAAWRGAIDQWGTLWRFLDDVNEMLIAMRG